MGFAEFEEKDFERPLYNQLEDGDCDVWSPGQCFEAHLGFDYAGNISISEFWNRFSGVIPKGVILDNYNIGYILKKVKSYKKLPNFSLNLFIQAKRPYIHTGKYYKAIYKCKHYSFKVNQKQQAILDVLAHKLHNEALFVYAAPIFGTYDELYQHTKQRTIIANTSFPKVSELSGHAQWYYCDAENGIAHSEPEEEITFDIFELIEKMRQEQYNTEDTRYDKNINMLSEAILNVLNEFRNDLQVEYFFSQLREMRDIYEHSIYRTDNINYKTYISFLTIATFSDIFNLDWFTLQ